MGRHLRWSTSFNGEVLFRGVDANGQAGLWVTKCERLFSDAFPAFTILNGEVALLMPVDSYVLAAVPFAVRWHRCGWQFWPVGDERDCCCYE